jgi:hypothetical protein
VRTYTTLQPPPTHSRTGRVRQPTHPHTTHRSTPAPRKCGLRFCFSFTKPHSLFSYPLDFFCSRQNISIFLWHVPALPKKSKSRARSCAHASADSSFLLFFLAVGFCGGASDFVRPRHLVLLLQAASLFVHFLHCIAMVTLRRILFDMAVFIARS